MPQGFRYQPRMIDADDKLTPADPREIATALALGLTSDRQMAKYQAAETMAKIVAERPVEHLDQSGFVVMRKPSADGTSPLYYPDGWPRTKRQTTWDGLRAPLFATRAVIPITALRGALCSDESRGRGVSKMSYRQRPHESGLAISSETEALVSGAGMLEDGGGGGVGGMAARNGASPSPTPANVPPQQGGPGIV
jgi:hypothetical protein